VEEFFTFMQKIEAHVVWFLLVYPRQGSKKPPQPMRGVGGGL
jgi:hypothetical protein